MPDLGCVAFIPARGGSRRVPRKNVIDVGGRPLITWTIQAAIQSGIFDQIIVSTDDDEIAAVARAEGVTVLSRSGALAADEATVIDVITNYLQQLGDDRPGTLVVLYATAALRTAEDIVATVSLLNEDCDFAMSVSRYPLPPHQAMQLKAGDRVEVMWPDLIEKRASDIGELVVDNGSTYATRTEALLQHGTFFGPGLRVHVMPFTRSIDLDEEEDLQLLNKLLEGSGS